MTTYFISDLHLDAHHPKVTDCLLQFLQTQACNADALYVLGDLFEFWIGDDDVTPLHQTIIDAFRKLTDSGVPVYFMHGNRDFLIGKTFAKQTGITLLPDPTVITLYGKKLLLMHGDLLCTDDVKYQAFRRRVHNPIIRACFLALPLKWRRIIADKARSKSQQHTSQTDLSIQDVNTNTVDDYMHRYNIDTLIHGHTHRPAIHRSTDNKKRVVLNSWHEHGGGIIIKQNCAPAFFKLTYI